MQTGPDLVSAGYPTARPLAAMLGGLANQISQPNLPARTNLDFAFGNVTDGALAATGVVKSVAVPVVPGDTFTKVTILVGATAAGVPTHGFAALYSGLAVPALLAQSADLTSGAVAASAAFTYTLQSAVAVTQVNAPNGFIYASVSETATTVMTAASVAVPAAVFYQWNASAPLFAAATHGSGVGGTAPATIASPTAATPAPIVFLQ